MEGHEKDPCQMRTFLNSDPSEDQQQMVLSKPEIWKKQKSEASMRLFTSMMLHTWRQRRKEVRELQEVVQKLQYRYMKSKNELHVYGTLMRVEQKRNRELQMQLKESTMSIGRIRTSCESLASSVRNLTTEKIQLQTDLDQRSQEYNHLEEMSGQTKKLLFTANMKYSNLQRQLTAEQRTSQHLKHQNDQLIKEVFLAESKKAKYNQVRDWYHRQLAQKEERISALNGDIITLEKKLQTISDDR
ncbi:protein NETWORKED 1A isoform X2 [Drosophila eugracilis]|uniref:protein NETWORKED 1A isoform X2 n=1 Tax=Drosophila eugracilis TaxID=29029 RepID=UPI001BDB5232|nr:protein NETWORKED 1A isoform X2 [Drosophila eugracilis]